MEITESLQGQVCQFNLNGRFDSYTCESVEQFIWKRIDGGVYNIVLNMENVNFTSSAGMRVILVVAKMLRKDHGGDLRIASPQPNVLKVFKISGIDNVLQIFTSAEEAVKSFEN